MDMDMHALIERWKQYFDVHPNGEEDESMGYQGIYDNA